MKIIGHGDIASALIKHTTTLKNRLYFASGVSNPKEARESEFQREKDLLAKQKKDLQIMYFSSLSIFTTESRYTQHKKEMEALVKKFPKYAIVRIGTITWGNNNPNTLVNFLRGKVNRGEPFKIRDVNRYVLDESEFMEWVNLTPLRGNWEMNITGRKLTELQIFRRYVSHDYPL